MPQGKWNAYENDLRIPFMIRGPGIQAGSFFEGLGSNVDVMPTLLGLVGGSAAQPALWDGRSAAALLLGQATLRTAGWRSDLLVEYFSGGEVVRYQHLEDAHNNSFRLLRRLTAGANLSFAQFVGPDNWNFTSEVPAAETELFDLAADPFQLRNLYSAAAPALRDELEAALSRLFECAGATCD
jgi:N-acetylglucosamine-6-sulfatase